MRARGHAIAVARGIPRVLTFLRHFAPAAVVFLIFACPGFGAAFERVSVSGDGAQTNASSGHPAISHDGRFVAFHSVADNLVPNDTNGLTDVFVHGRLTRATERVSVASDGAQGNGHSRDPSISADGRFVAFLSAADNLVQDDTNGVQDVFVRDRLEGTTRRVSVGALQANALCESPAISADGRFVAFASDADNLAPGDTNRTTDIFVHDIVTGITERVSLSSSGAQRDLWSGFPSISGDGRFVPFIGDTRDPDDGIFRSHIFIRDRLMQTTQQVERPKARCVDWPYEGPDISADGRFVAFSYGDDLEGGPLSDCCNPASCAIILYDQEASVAVRVGDEDSSSSGIYASRGPALSDDGRYLCFIRYDEWWDRWEGGGESHQRIWIYDSATGQEAPLLRRGIPVDGWSGDISGDGRFLVFTSDQADLVPEDTNGASDIFVYDRFPADAPPETVITSGPCGAEIPPGDVRITWEGIDDTTPPESLVFFWRLDALTGENWRGPTTDRQLLLPRVSCYYFYTLEVMARDLAGNEDPTPARCDFAVGLSLRWLSPAPGQTVRGVVNVCVEALPADSVARVEFQAPGPWFCSDATAPYCCAWDTRLPYVLEGETWVRANADCATGGGSGAYLPVVVDNTTFDDVRKWDVFWQFIEALSDARLTSGCSSSPPLYCPDAWVTRGQMAQFICKAAGKTWLDRPSPTFMDVPKTHPFYGWIERVVDRASWSVTPPAAACLDFGARRYFCPGYPVARDHMARALCIAAGKTPLYSPTPAFMDAPATGPFYGWIQRLADSASWGGKTPSNGCRTVGAFQYFCPRAPVTRGQIAKLLVLTFGLPYYQG
jgi:Tol biopolymer transport system component